MTPEEFAEKWSTKNPAKNPDWQADLDRLVLYAAHNARIEYMNALGQGHFSRVDPVWHVKHYRETLLTEVALKVIEAVATTNQYSGDHVLYQNIRAAIEKLKVQA